MGICAPRGIRTPDLDVNSVPLYQLSYRSINEFRCKPSTHAPRPHFRGHLMSQKIYLRFVLPITSTSNPKQNIRGSFLCKPEFHFKVNCRLNTWSDYGKHYVFFPILLTLKNLNLPEDVSWHNPFVPILRSKFYFQAFSIPKNCSAYRIFFWRRW